MTRYQLTDYHTHTLGSLRGPPRPLAEERASMVEYTVLYRYADQDRFRWASHHTVLADATYAALWRWDRTSMSQVQVRDQAGKLLWYAGGLEGCPERDWTDYRGPAEVYP